MNSEIKNVNILVVEDIIINQLLMKILLAEFGFNRDVAENGRIAVEMLQANTYDLVLMDLRMPEMDGFETTTYIRNTLNSNIPIIALTADLTSNDLAKCKEVGMDDYIAKPVDRDLLYSKIIELIKDKDKGEKIESQRTPHKYVNLDFLNSRTKSNASLMLEMISAFLIQTPPLVSAMTQALIVKDYEGLYSAVHKMIPSFSIMGMSDEYEKMARNVLELTHTDQQHDKMSKLVSQLENICTQSCEELQEEYNTIKSTNS